MNSRVVVTGMGVVTPIGIGIENFWNNLLKGTNGVRKIVSFDPAGYRTETGAEVLDFDDYIKNNNLLKNYGRATQFSIVASKEALDMAQIDKDYIKNNRGAITLGTTMGEMQILEQFVESFIEQNILDSNLPRKYPPNVIVNNLSSYFEIFGQNIVIPSACAAGNFAIGYGYDLIKSNRADFVLTGGVDPFSKIAFAGFNKLMACSPDICSPFDKNRKGMIVGEGAGFLVLENLEKAKNRGAKIFAEILGYGVSNDAYKSTIPHPEGKGGIVAVQKAIKNSNITINDIDYICAHGTGTIENDKVETIITKEVFGKRAYEIPISSLKSMLGHTMGACSSIEAIACIKMLCEKVVIPTINYKTKDPLCDLDYVPNQYRKLDIKTVLNNSYAFGGNNSSVVIREYY